MSDFLIIGGAFVAFGLILLGAVVLTILGERNRW